MYCGSSARARRGGDPAPFRWSMASPRGIYASGGVRPEFWNVVNLSAVPPFEFWRICDADALWRLVNDATEVSAGVIRLNRAQCDCLPSS